VQVNNAGISGVNLDEVVRMCVCVYIYDYCLCGASVNVFLSFFNMNSGGGIKI